jgi:signal transduction histidine kinase/predicted RNA-binding protein with RPS1 domain/ActR/RegA family two-component response regulator
MSWDWVKTKYEGKKIQGKVMRLLAEGALIELEPNIVGAIWSKELAWGREPPHPIDILSHGQKINVLVLEVDTERERITLSLKQALDDPWQGVEQKFLVGAAILAEVVQLVPSGAFVELTPGVEGRISLSQLAPYDVARPEDALSIGDNVMVKVLSCDEGKKEISLSIKAHLLDVARKGGKNYRILEKALEEEVLKTLPESTEIVDIDQYLDMGEVTASFLDKEAVSIETVKKRQQTKILLVDDEKDVRESSQARLELAWFDVAIATDGKKAIQKASNNEYVIILMDVHMPDMDGLETTKIMREKGVNTPVVLFTAHNPTMYFGAYRRDFPGLNIVNVLRKPLDFIDIARTVDEIVGGHSVSTPMEMLPEEDVPDSKKSTLTLSETPLERKLEEIIANLQNDTGAEALALFHLLPTYETKLIVHSGIAPSDFEKVKYNLRYSPVRNVVEDQTEILEGDVKSEAADEFKNLLPLLPNGFNSCIGLPIKIAEKTEHAIFLLHHQGRFFEKLDLERTKIVATLVGSEIEKSEIMASLLKSHAFSQRGQMTSSLIHELRNRLTTLSNYSDVVAIQFDRLEKGQTNLDDEHASTRMRRAIGGIQTAKEKIDSLANAFSEMGKGKSYQPLDINIYIAKILNFLDPMMQFAGVRQEQGLHEKLPKIMASGINIEQILLNLVLNAIQQIDSENVSGGVVKISTAYEPKDELPVKVRVMDNGPGIHKHDFEKIFSLGHTTREEGAGLGLFIARRMAEDLGGRITVEKSTVFYGSTFLFELPTSDIGEATR